MERSSSGQPSDAPVPPSVFQRLATILLIIVGVQLWLVLGTGDYGLSRQRYLLLAALGVALVPPLNRAFFVLLDRIRQPSRRAALIAAVVISLVSACYLPFTAWNQGRNLAPKWQDEMSYLIQIQMLARGRLWMPMHPLADFFDSFQLIVDPVYASMYFPGASMLYVPAVWMGMPYWVISAAAAGACVGLVYWIIHELIDGVAAALAALMMLGQWMFRRQAVMVLGQPAILLFGLAMFACWLCWRRERRARWAVLTGLFAGWAAITRPLDAVILAAPIGIDMLLCLRGSPPQKWFATGAWLVAGAAPFLLLQIIFNVGVTGSWRQTPFELYADRDYPGTTLGFHEFDPSRRPVSQLPQKQKFHDQWTIPAIQQHRPLDVISSWVRRGFRDTLGNTLPHRLMIVLLPAGLLGLACRARLMLWLTIPLFVVLISLYTWILPHYAIIIIPAMLLTVLLGQRQVESCWPTLRQPVGTFLVLGLAILSLTEMYEFNRLIRDELFDPSGLRNINARLQDIEHKPAVVLFRFSDSNPHEEPVYNTDVAWPDDAPIIRAHDLGETRNQEIYRYYAQRQPERAFYLYDRADDSIRFLGLAGSLVR